MDDRSERERRLDALYAAVRDSATVDRRAAFDVAMNELTRGAAFIDAGCFLIRAMAAGHSASQAEALVALCPGRQQAPAAAIDVFGNGGPAPGGAGIGGPGI